MLNSDPAAAAGAEIDVAGTWRRLENMRIPGLGLLTYCRLAFAGVQLNLFPLEAAGHTIADTCPILVRALFSTSFQGEAEPKSR